MEKSSQPRLRPFERVRRAAHFVVDHVHLSAPDFLSDHYRPSARRDVGKSAAQAAGVQLVLEGLEHYSPERPDVVA